MGTNDNSVDDAFFDRADEVIRLANQQLGAATPGTVSASTLYAAARFNAWVTAIGSKSGAELERNLDETLEHFVEQYRKMLKENLQDYADNFDRYIKVD